MLYNILMTIAVVQETVQTPEKIGKFKFEYSKAEQETEYWSLFS